ncbi:MAG: Gfo/Idh/MocA family oxidoreductase [Chitinophagales bacterium]|nr:Gfo/Idh/MocA family oxidoreductase [Chitinophagales bacterium]
MKVGVIGLGHLGNYHIQNWLKLIDNSDLYIFDIDPDIVSKLALQYQVIPCDSFDELLNVVEIVDIVTPTGFHYAYAIRSIEAQKHIFIEKPITFSIDEADDLVSKVENYSKIIQIGHVERFNQAFRAAYPLLKSPKFFEIHRLAPYNPRGTDVSVVLDLMIHDLDLVLFLTNTPIKAIYANGVSIISNTWDIVNCRIEFEGNIIANLTSSRISMKKMRKFRIFEENQYMSIDFSDSAFEHYKISSDLDSGVEFINNLGEKRSLQYLHEEFENNNSILNELSDFLNAIQTSSKPSVTVLQATNALKLAYKIQDTLMQSETKL